VYYRGVLVKEFFKAFRISELVLEAFRIKLDTDRNEGLKKKKKMTRKLRIIFPIFVNLRTVRAHTEEEARAAHIARADVQCSRRLQEFIEKRNISRQLLKNGQEAGG